MQPEEETTNDFAIVDINNYNIDAFDMDPSSVKKQTFKDDKTGKDNSYYTGVLTYHGKAPMLVVEGDTYGVQKQDENKKKEGGDDEVSPPGALPLPNLVQLPSALAPSGAVPGAAGGAYVKKEKYQIAFKLSGNPAPASWTPQEKRMVDFLDNDIRRILAHVLAKRLPILTAMNSPVITDAQQQIMEEMSDPNKAAALMTQEAQLIRFTQIVKDKLFGKISRKCYRKKKKAVPGAPVNIMDASAQYDETSYPTLYASIMNYIDKTTKQEVVSTVYKKFYEDVAPEQYPTLTHAEALAMGNYHCQGGIRFDGIYFGTAYSPQLKAGNVTFVYPVSGGGGAKNSKIVMPAPVIKKDSRLVQRSAIQPGPAGAPTVPVETNTTPQNYQPTYNAPVAFDPSGLAGVPGLGMPVPGAK